METKQTQRRFDLDWLRVIAFTILILFHTGMMFNTWDWHIKNNNTTVSIEPIMEFVHQWRMPLLFFVSGAAVWFALQKYSTARFAKERLKRLLLPLAFGMFVVIPPQVYYERIYSGQHFESPVAFYSTVLALRPYPEGNFSWHHLWYIPYILVFSFLALPLFLYLRRPSTQQKIAVLSGKFRRRGALLLFALPLAASEILLRPFWPGNTNNLIADWAQFSTTLILFSTGYLAASNDAIWDSIQEYRCRALCFGVLTFAAISLFWIADQDLDPVPRAFYRFCRSMNMWCWLLAILGFGRKYLNRNHPFLKIANEAVYPFYIVHQTVTVVIGFYLIHWQVGIGMKFLVVASGTFLISWMIFAIIRRTNVTRALFGLRPLPAPKTYETARHVAHQRELSFGSE